MASITEQICARIAAVLTGTTNAGAAVYRDRQDAFTREESPAILIEATDEPSDPLGDSPAMGGIHALDKVRLTVAVTVCVRSATWQAVADAVRVQAHALILADTQLRQLAQGIQRGRAQWDAANADTPFGYVSQTYIFTYLNRAQALDAAA